MSCKLRLQSVTHPEGARVIVVVLPDDLLGSLVTLSDLWNNNQFAHAGDKPEYGAAVEFMTNASDHYALKVPDCSYHATIPCLSTFSNRGTLAVLEHAVPPFPPEPEPEPEPEPDPCPPPSMTQDEFFTLALAKMDLVLDILENPDTHKEK
jgi:hypothetical protein